MKTDNALKKFKILIYVELAAAAVLVLFSINFSLDISLLAFPIALGYTGLLIYLAIFKMLKEENGKLATVVWKLFDYLPYVHLITFVLRRAGKNGTPYWYDLITVLLWFVIFISSFFISFMMNPKRSVEKLFKNWKYKPEVDKKYTGGKKALVETLEWIDALAWSVFTLMIFQIFFMQLYKIPSESMVPQYLVKDNVLVSKFDCGPKFPLTDVGLPDFREYKRGDSIVLRNPHYTIDRKSEVKTWTSQLIYMLSIMTINLNRDESGELKADPLVKRITGLPGEQLVMQDGTLYSRTKDHDFEPVELDNQFAAWNLNKVDNATKRKIERIPLSSSEYEKMIAFEEERRCFDLNNAKKEAKDIAEQFSKLAYTDNFAGKFEVKTLYEYELFTDAQNITRQLMCQEGGAAWFTKFMTSWINSADEVKDIYAEANFKLNVMTKLAFGKIIVRYAKFFRENVNAATWASDSLLAEYYEMAETLVWYVQGLLDQRNMPVFPANDAAGNAQYIPSNCYFMMGDNRFNSLDLRHSMEQELVPLTPYDSISVEYYSLMAPQYINKKYIIGKPVFIFWPAGRMGKVK